jgi:hypothetical protein
MNSIVSVLLLCLCTELLDAAVVKVPLTKIKSLRQRLAEQVAHRFILKHHPHSG